MSAPSAPFSMRVRPGAALIDNSTYFSAKAALEERLFDADVVHNLALLLEAIVFSDTVVTAPTNAWRPSASDTLYANGVCVQLSLTELTTTAVRNLYLNAIDDAMADLASPTTGRDLNISLAHYAAARKILLEWREIAQSKPRAFETTYSGAVYITDTASRQMVKGLRTGVDESMPKARQVTQYLLRTNVAVQFATALTYLPHSYRARLVQMKWRRRSSEQRAAIELVRAAEGTIRDLVTMPRGATLVGHMPLYVGATAAVPLVFAATLAHARTPADLLTLALQIRESHAAQKYRAFFRAYITALRSESNPSKLNRLHADFEASRDALSKELSRLFGPQGLEFATTTRVLAAVTAVAKEPSIREGLKQLVNLAPPIAAALRKFDPAYRRIAVIAKLANERQRIQNLNKSLFRVFHRRLSNSDLDRFATLSAGPR